MGLKFDPGLRVIGGNLSQIDSIDIRESMCGHFHHMQGFIYTKRKI